MDFKSWIWIRAGGKIKLILGQLECGRQLIHFSVILITKLLQYPGGPKALKQHMKLHGSKRQYKCNYCIKDFISLSRLNHHVQNVHAEPNFHCEQCPKMFRSKVNFNRHMLVHTNEKPFVCPHCLFSCNNSANLNSHVRSVHKEKEFTTGSKEKAAKRAMITKNVMKNKVALNISKIHCKSY